MATQYKAQKNKYILMSCKMEAAAGELKLSLGTQEALKSIAAATSCMKGIEGMNPEAVAYALVWRYRRSRPLASLTRQWMISSSSLFIVQIVIPSQEVMDKVLGPTVGDSVSVAIGSLS